VPIADRDEGAQKVSPSVISRNPTFAERRRFDRFPIIPKTCPIDQNGFERIEGIDYYRSVSLRIGIKLAQGPHNGIKVIDAGDCINLNTPWQSALEQERERLVGLAGEESGPRPRHGKTQ